MQPEVAEHHVQLAAARLRAAAATGDVALLQGAVEAALWMRERWPDDWRSHALVGDVLNNAGETERALEAYRRCSDLAPRSIARCEIKIARTLLALGRHEEAAALLIEVFGEEPEASQAAELLAVARRPAKARE